ncbi:MAG: hypothetical protein ACQKBY_10140 [Verrucomicrobiales bacterium]
MHLVKASTYLALALLLSCKEPPIAEPAFTAQDIAFAVDAELFNFRLPDDLADSDRLALQTYSDDGIIETAVVSESFTKGGNIMVIIQKNPYRFTVTKKGLTTERTFNLGAAKLQMWEAYVEGDSLNLNECFAVFSEDGECSTPPRGNDIGVRMVVLSP